MQRPFSRRVKTLTPVPKVTFMFVAITFDNDGFHDFILQQHKTHTYIACVDRSCGDLEQNKPDLNLNL